MEVAQNVQTKSFDLVAGQKSANTLMCSLTSGTFDA